MNKVGINHSRRWIGEAFGMLRRHPVPFLLMGLVYTLLAQLPWLIGFFIALFLGPALMGGMIHAAREAAAGRTPRVGQLFHAFQEGDRIGSYIALSLPVIGLVFVMVAMLIPVIGPLVASLQAQAGGSGADAITYEQLRSILAQQISATPGTFFLLVLFYLLGAFVVSMLTFLAPARIMLARETAFTAMRSSFAACRTNLGPYFLLGILMFLIALGMMTLARVLGTVLPPALASLLAMGPFNAFVALVVFATHRSMFGDQTPSQEQASANPAEKAPDAHTFEA